MTVNPNNSGIAKSKVMSFTMNEWSHIDYFDIPQNAKVATFAAGYTIKYGKFKKRFSDQKILLDGDWADPIAAPELITASGMVWAWSRKDPGEEVSLSSGW